MIMFKVVDLDNFAQFTIYYLPLGGSFAFNTSQQLVMATSSLLANFLLRPDVGLAFGSF